MRRAWIFLIPLGVYLVWWLWALDSAASAGTYARASNALLIPNYIADSLAAVTAALAGLDYGFAGLSHFVELDWGRVVALVAVVALALRIRRGNVPPSLWVSLGILLSVWTLGALVFGPTREPAANRFTYMGAVGVLLVATDAARSVRFSRPGLAALFAAAAVSLATNLALLRDGSTATRDDSTEIRAQFAMLELARDHVDPDFSPGVWSPINEGAGAYFTVVDRYGSLGLPLPELEREADSVRQSADAMLARALRLRLERSPSGGAGCRELRETAGFELPPGGASLRATGADQSAVGVGRFADLPSLNVGRVSGGEWVTLRIPPDSSPRSWRASIEGAKSVEVCGVS
jgi:hypothetical protein